MKRTLLVFSLLMMLVWVLPSAAQEGTGTLEFYANGEDFVREGFVSKDGWAITFDAVTITLAEIVAYQADPPYIPDMGPDVAAQLIETLDGVYVVDLAEGDADADRIYIGEITQAAAGQYNALSWTMVNSPDNDGYTLVIIGTAQKDDVEIDFTFSIETEYAYTCGEYVGDERKGILDADESADLELTFHFDHVFGDGTLPLDDGLNVHAPGFEMFAQIAVDGVIDVTMADLELLLDPDDYQMVVDILPTLGHVGEGHCYEPTMVIEEEADEAPDDAADDADDGAGVG